MGEAPLSSMSIVPRAIVILALTKVGVLEAVSGGEFVGEAEVEVSE